MLSIAYIPCPSEAEALKISETLVKQGLIACANVFKSRSVYSWKGKLENTDEWVIVAKTLPEKLDGLRAKVKELHSYETPCIVSFSAADSNAEYLGWVKKQVKKQVNKQVK